MPRRNRELSATNMYHVVIRGADHQVIFIDEKDYRKYLEILAYNKERLEFQVYAFCLMSNHVHLLIRTGETPLSTIFRCINTRYSLWFNMKYNRTGHLQQGRYFSRPVESRRQLMDTIRYIHQNPYKAGLEKSIGSDYLWSSFYDYKAGIGGLTDIENILEEAGGNDAFFEYQKGECEEDHLDIDTIRKRLPDDVAIELICSICECDSPLDVQKLPIVEQARCFVQLKQSRVSVCQINRITGIPQHVIKKSIRDFSDVGR